ncbi:XRE family transcriptional regulator [Streptomyces sp. NPDC004539]|uniref:helix-turn-helix domain-containing protein n=1 Tax=Streptomyces sp. NPDC004539 TaxID=3154280 RepID=UPI0033B35640
MSSENALVAHNVRLLRERRGLSQTELARRAGLAKQTLSRLEQGTGNPTVDTLFAIAAALRVPVARLVADRGRTVAVHRGEEVGWERAAGYEWRALGQVYGSGVVENFLVRVPAREGGAAEAHPAGTLEQVYVVSGRVRVGPADSPVELSAGDSVRYPGDRPHVYESLHGVSVVHVMVSVPYGGVRL